MLISSPFPPGRVPQKDPLFCEVESPGGAEGGNFPIVLHPSGALCISVKQIVTKAMRFKLEVQAIVSGLVGKS